MLSIGLETGQLSYIPHVFMNRSCILVIDHGWSEVPALEAVSSYCPNLDSRLRIGICLFLWRFMGTGQRAALLKWLRVRMGFRWAELLIGQHERFCSWFLPSRNRKLAHMGEDGEQQAKLGYVKPSRHRATMWQLEASQEHWTSNGQLCPYDYHLNKTWSLDHV